MNTTEIKKSASLKYRTTKVVGREKIIVNIRLDDQCNNGHQDFAITGDIYEAGKPQTDRNHIAGGCIHDTIEKHFPEFIPFIKLHLCDYEGIPMFAVENGFYHLRNGFHSKSTGLIFKSEYCDYYRISYEQFEALYQCPNQIQFALMLKDLGILVQWKEEADKAIKMLEELTDTQFIVDSAKSQYNAPTPEQIEEDRVKRNSGFYTPEATAKRAEQAKQDFLVCLDQERDEKIKRLTIEYDIKKALYNVGGSRALENAIYYDHSNTVAFNWRKYGDELTKEEIQEILSKIVLPDGVKTEIKKP